MPHKVTLEQREKLTLTGATEIVQFDGEMARIHTEAGTVCIYGSELKLKTLSLEGGTVSVHGQIDAIVYEVNQKSGRWSRLWK